MAAQNKDELLQITNKEYAKLSKLLTTIAPDAATKKRDDDTSIKDVIGHRAHWIALFLGWYADGMAGEEVFFPAPGYKWNQLKAYNRNLRAEQVDLSWPGAIENLRVGHDKLIGFITGHTTEELYGGPMKGANNNWTPGRWAEAAGPSHYRSASKYIRKCVREDG